MASNLPPGVTVGMIPGNRPEDAAEEAFWEAFEGQCREDDVVLVGDYAPETNDKLERMLVIARDLGIEKGYADAKADAAIDEVVRGQEREARQRQMFVAGLEYVLKVSRATKEMSTVAVIEQLVKEYDR